MGSTESARFVTEMVSPSRLFNCSVQFDEIARKSESNCQSLFTIVCLALPRSPQTSTVPVGSQFYESGAEFRGPFSHPGVDI
jgi:hypothetical protein